MAIYHLSVKTISRSKGRSATAAAAYRAGVSIYDDRTETLHNYTRKQGVESSILITPDNAPDWASDRSNLWNAAEQSEKRKNSTVAREFEIALPAELDSQQREQLAYDFAQELVDKHGFAADVCIHQPDLHNDRSNHHAHILCTTRKLEVEGFTQKTRELDDRKNKQVDYWRERFGELQNEHLEKAGLDNRVDHRSLKDQGVERLPQIHLGAKVREMEKRGIITKIGDQYRAIEKENNDLAIQKQRAESVDSFKRDREALKAEREAVRNKFMKKRAERKLQKEKEEQAREKAKEKQLMQERQRKRERERDSGLEL